MPRLAVKIGLRHPQSLGRELVVARLIRRQDRINDACSRLASIVGLTAWKELPQAVRTSTLMVGHAAELGDQAAGQGFGLAGHRPSIAD